MVPRPRLRAPLRSIAGWVAVRYFARKSSGAANAYPRDTWVAISRPPYFTALALWFVGGTYCMGGCFPAPGAVWLGFGDQPPDQGALPRWLTADHGPATLCRPHEQLDGSDGRGQSPAAGGLGANHDAPAETWGRRHPSQPGWLLTLRERLDFGAYGGPYVTEYAVQVTPGAAPTPLEAATWADWDQQGRPVLARDGALFHWQPPDRHGARRLQRSDASTGACTYLGRDLAEAPHRLRPHPLQEARAAPGPLTLAFGVVYKQTESAWGCAQAPALAGH